MRRRRRGSAPRLAAVLVRLLVGRSESDRALADLEDAYGHAASRGGRGYARRRYWREALLIVAWSLVGRVRAGRGGRGGVETVRIGWRGDRERGSGAAVAMLRAGPVGRRRPLADLAQDVRFGFRALARRPGFALTVVAVLALGIGANTTMFTLANRLFLSAPPLVERPTELVRLFRSWAPGQGGSMSYPNYREYRGARSLSSLMAYSPQPIAVTARSEGALVPARAWTVSGDYFAVLGLWPAAGRFFLPEEDRTPGTHPVVVVSHGFWRERLGGDAAAVGRRVTLNGHAFTVVGVAPAGYEGLSPAETTPEFYIPLMMRDAVKPSTSSAWRERVPNMRENWLTVVGRLAAGVPFETARAELESIAAAVAERHRETSEAESVWVTRQFRYHPGATSALERITRTLLAIVALVLAIATANAAILLLSRASSRRRELDIRAALGAGRGRVARLLLIESLLLGLAGGALGLLLSYWGASLAGALLPVPLEAATPDARVLVSALAVSVGTAVLAGLAPAIAAGRPDRVGLLRTRGASEGRSRAQAALVVTQVALSLMLVAGAALFVRSLVAARSEPIGFDPGNVVVVEVNLRNHGYDAERGRAFLAAALDRVAAVPGVAIATATRQAPFQGDWTTTLEPWSAETFASGARELEVGLNVVAPGYFDALGIRIVRGRALDQRDTPDADLAVVINETLAGSLWPGQDPIGRTIPLQGPDAPPMTVVGLAADATYYQLGEAPWTQAYGSFAQSYQPNVTFLAKTAADPMTVARGVRAAIQSLDGDVAVASMTTMQAQFDAEIARFSATAHLVAAFGALSLLLAGIGLYGVLSLAVVRRTPDIGVRMALGATHRRVARDVLGHGLGLTIIGIAIGTAAALAAARLIGGLLFEIDARDPISFALAPAVLLAVGCLAVLAPVRRAMRVDPMRTIRGDAGV